MRDDHCIIYYWGDPIERKNASLTLWKIYIQEYTHQYIVKDRDRKLIASDPISGRQQRFAHTRHHQNEVKEYIQVHQRWSKLITNELLRSRKVNIVETCDVIAAVTSCVWVHLVWKAFLPQQPQHRVKIRVRGPKMDRPPTAVSIQRHLLKSQQLLHVVVVSLELYR